jgi:RNA polymerase sigma-70 factor (ECF subfamily)
LKVLENGVDEQQRVAAAQRDPALFAELYEANFDRVYAYIARRVPTRQDAEDLTSEVFHEALRCLGHYQCRGLPFAAWLFGIAGKRLANKWRRNGKRPETATDDLGEVGFEAGIEEAAMLAKLVDELPADQGLVIRRRFVEQKSLREIANELGRSEGAIKQLQFRALQNLRTKLGKGHV